ncbi:MAG: AAA domain-containing protein [Thermomicrobiales bacterium]
MSQFVRLDQCRRYLRLALHARAAGLGFLRDYDVAPQEIPPLLTRAGAEFERRVEIAAADAFPVRLLARERADSGRENDNDTLATAARDVLPGETVILFQPRLHVAIDGWDMTGDADIVRLERREDGVLRLLVADMKATTAAKVEHRLQVAFYREMIEHLLCDAGISLAASAIGILYRGAPGVVPDRGRDDGDERDVQKEAARRLFGVEDAFFEQTPDPDAYRDTARALVLGESSVANEVISERFEDIPWHLTYKCDGCLYNEFCMKWAAERDDLSLLPHITDQDKSALLQVGIGATRQLAQLLVPTLNSSSGEPGPHLLGPTPETSELAQRVARSWPVGPRVDELVHRARRYRSYQGDTIQSLPYIPSKGYGSLPFSSPDQNPNLVRIFIDAQHDYLHDRIYLIGSLVVGNENGAPVPERRRSIVTMTDGVPDEGKERALLVEWIDGTIRAIAEVAAPDAEGQPTAPMHLIFFNGFEQRLLLEALNRHARDILAATPIYDFLTQLAAFDSPVATFLDREIRELKNYPFVCQSLQAVAAVARPSGARFDWNAPEPFREIFRERMFDALGRLDPIPGGNGKPGPWVTRRARFNSQIPLEYAYAAWDALDVPTGGGDLYEQYRRSTVPLLRAFQARRLEAMEHVANDFRGNKDTTKSNFVIPDIASFDGKARGLAEALQEFVTIERHVDLAAWKSARLPPPERRVLAGDTLITRYQEEDQDPEVAAANAENLRRTALKARFEAELDINEDGSKRGLPRDVKAATKPIEIEQPFRLRIDVSECPATLDDVLALSSLKEGDHLVIAPRWTQDGRLPLAERTDLTPTPKQLLYRMRCSLERIEIIRDEAGLASEAWLHVLPAAPMSSGNPPGFLFAGRSEPLRPNERYTIDADPNDIYGFWSAKVVQGLLAGGQNALFARIRDGRGWVHWPPAAKAGQERFMAGLRALRDAGVARGFEQSKETFIGARGDVPLLLVQGPPGTGKSFTTAYAILARLQGAMAAELPFRVAAGAKTHAATDVLLEHILDARLHLASVAESHPDLFDEYFDRRLLSVPLFRLQGREELTSGITRIFAKGRRPKDQPRVAALLRGIDFAIVATTPGGIYAAASDEKSLFDHPVFNLLVLDEASQLSLPESIMAALMLAMDGQVVIVGDHRQMAPIVKHDWDNETRRTFQDYAVYRSLFDTVRQTDAELIQFSQSFRLDRDMAEFLRRAVYAQDGLSYHSARIGRLKTGEPPDPYVAAVLSPEHPLIVVVHDERSSQLRNDFERRLTTPLIAALHAMGYDVDDGFGLVVPHRAQRANLQEALRAAVAERAAPDEVARAVDTVERFQGGERHAIVVSATESDPAYLLAAGKFLYDPRRLTVAISRAKDKMILVASRSVFALFSPDEAIFANAQIWKDLLSRTCTVPLWAGEIDQHQVQVWGNPPLLLLE